MTRREILAVLDRAAENVGWTDGATGAQRYRLACRLEELDMTPEDIGIGEDTELYRSTASSLIDVLK